MLSIGITALITISGISCAGVILSATAFSNASLKASKFSKAIVIPAAAKCPPYPIKCALQACKASYKLKPTTLLALPVTTSPLCVSTIVGL